MSKMNGIDVNMLGSLAEKYKENPEEAITSFASTVKWKDGFYSEAEVGDYKPVPIDEPEWLSGTGKGPNPVELLLSALGACVGVGFIATASGMGIKVNSLAVDVTGDIDLNVFFGLKEGNSGFNEINVRFNVDSDADEAQVEKLVAKAIEISPVRNTIERNVKVTSEYTLHN
ncbi:MAG: OsmC family protein [Bacillota bacterium]